MSPAYQKGLRDHLPEANATFDRFHVVKLLNEAVDQVRRSERKEARRSRGPGTSGFGTPARSAPPRRECWTVSSWSRPTSVP